MKLNEKNFELFAAKYYDNPNCVDMIEFYEDLNRIKYLKKLFKKYKDSGDIKPRLVLNHLIVLYNVFNPPIACTMLLGLKLKEHMNILKPFLIQLSFWPDRFEVGDDVILDSNIGLDINIVNLLRKELNKNEIG